MTRLTMDYQTEEDRKAAHREYYQKHKKEILEKREKYRQENKEKISEYNKKRYQNNKEKMLEQHKQYRQEHKEEIAEKQKQYYQEHKEKISEQQKQYRQKHNDISSKRVEYMKQYYQENKEEIAENVKQYNKTPFGRAVRLLNAYRREDKKYDRGECTLTAQWIVENIFTQKCHWCPETDWTKIGCDRIDNSLPHTPDNVIPCCERCNKKRGRKTYDEFKKALRAEETTL